MFGKQQIRDRPSGILWDFNEYGRNIRQQCSTTQRCCRMHKHNGLASVELLKDWLVIRMSQPLVVVASRQSNPVCLEYAIRVLDFAQAGLCIRKGDYGK
jgi:hypothetical protein